MLAHVTATAMSFACLAIVYGALERSFPARAARRFREPDVVTDCWFFLGQYFVWSTLAVALLAAFHGALNSFVPQALRSAAARLPLWLLASLAVVLGDVLVYWFHRACHRFEVLWRFHAVHHSSERLDWLAAHREHPVDGTLTQLAQNAPAMLLGLPFEALAVLIAFRGAWSILIHSNVRLPLGPFGFLFGAPELHHFHHARVERTAHNFGNLAPWLDVLFGTYRRPAGVESYPLGLCEPWPKGYLAQLARSFSGREGSLRRQDRAIAGLGELAEAVRAAPSAAAAPALRTGRERAAVE